MKGVGSPKFLFENLELPPIHTLFQKDLHTEGPGRRARELTATAVACRTPLFLIQDEFHTRTGSSPF